MRKFLLIAMVMLTLPVFAQNYTMRIKNIQSYPDYTEVWDYNYPGDMSAKLVSIDKYDFLSETEAKDSLLYDERGNILRISTWQKLGGEWIYPCYVEYEYNENDLRVSRKNYNNFDGFQLGGTYRYNYDDQGRMSDWTMDFANIPEYQKGVITYTEDGLKDSEVMQAYSQSTYYLENSTLTTYVYDDNNNVIRTNEHYWEAETWVLQYSRLYEYDEFGNCIKYEQVTTGGTVQEKRVYAYDLSISADDVYYYPNPEDDYPQRPIAHKNLLKSFDLYAQNDNNELGYVTTYQYGYEAGEFALAVEEVAVESNIYPNPAQDYVMVESSEAEYVEVVDMYGRVLFATEMSETIKVDMSEFASGIYFVKLQANGATSVQKVVKK